MCEAQLSKKKNSYLQIPTFSDTEIFLIFILMFKKLVKCISKEYTILNRPKFVHWVAIVCVYLLNLG